MVRSTYSREFMPKIILVKGSTNSHKTSSVTEFATRFITNLSYLEYPIGSQIAPSIWPSPMPANLPDFRAIGLCTKGGQNYKVGIASAGDNAAIINNNLAFFYNKNLDIIVTCSKAYGQSADAIQHHIYDPSGLFFGSTLHVTTTFIFPKSSPNIIIDTARTANDILQFI